MVEEVLTFLFQKFLFLGICIFLQYFFQLLTHVPFISQQQQQQLHQQQLHQQQQNEQQAAVPTTGQDTPEELEPQDTEHKVTVMVHRSDLQQQRKQVEQMSPQQAQSDIQQHRKPIEQQPPQQQQPPGELFL